MVERAQKSKFIGRARELAFLESALESAVAGHVSTVIIGGEAGVGKSRLVERFLESGKRDTTTVLVGTCQDFGDSPLAFKPVIEALRPIVDNVDDLTRTGSRSQFFEMVLTLLETTAADMPLVIVLEDFQWADQSTRDLLLFLIANLTEARVEFIVTYRSDELVDGDPFLRYVAELSRSEGANRLMLLPLEHEDLISHLDDLNDGPVEETLANQIWERSQGNPFYAEELLAAADQPEGLPQNVRDVLMHRVTSLDPATQAVLRIVATGGKTVDHVLLSRVAVDFKAEDLFEGLRDAIRHQIVTIDPEGNYVFRHSLLQEVVYSLVLPAERKAFHGRYAAALAELKATPAELAHHYMASGNMPEALVASIDAGGDAESARGYAESQVHYERALMIWAKVPEGQRPGGVDRTELLDRAASVAHLAGDNMRAVDLVRTALIEIDEGDPRTNLLRVRLGYYLGAMGDGQEALTEHEAVVREMSEMMPSSTHAEILCAYAQTLATAARHRESARHAEEALTMARAVKDRTQEAKALSVLGSNLVVLGQPETGASYLEDALHLAIDLDTPGEIAAGYLHLALTLSGPLNRLQEALDIALRGAAHVKKLGLERHWGVSLQSIASDTMFRMGRWDEAMALVTAAIRRSVKGVAALDLLLARAKLTVGRGDFELAEADLAAVAALSEKTIDIRYNIPLATLRAGLALWRDDLDAASAAIEDGMAQVGDTDDVWFAAPLVWHAMRVEAERAEQARADFKVDAAEKAIAKGQQYRQLSEKMCKSGRQQGALRLVVDAYDVMCEGEWLRIHGEAAPDVWSVVASSWDELGQPYPAAYARWRWAEALLARRKNASRATPLLAEAHGVALKLGAAPMRIHIEDLARRARIDLTSSSVETDEAVVDIRDATLERLRAEAGLTKREAEVLQLVAEGKSNRGIAEACFISEKTASVHVSNILMKLGVQSRVQAAAVFHRALTR